MRRTSLLLGLFVFACSSFGQVRDGNIRGRVFGPSGEPLPNALVTLEGPQAPIDVRTLPSGTFRFLNVPIGTYRVRVESPGLATYIQENIPINAGTNVTLDIDMREATVEEDTVVVTEPPVGERIDTSVSDEKEEEELQEVPSARDPWVVLQQIPGIMVLKENVGGSASGQQSSWEAKGGMDDSWNMDGMDVCSSHTGGSYMYYDFDAFEQIQVGTAGQNASIQSSGTSINFVVRKGTNDFTGNARLFYTNSDLQADNRTEEIKDLGLVGDQINMISDYGANFGGPLLRDRLFFSAGVGVQDIRMYAITGFPDDTKIVARYVKVATMPSERNRLNGLYMKNVKTKDGRDAAADRPPETTYDQDGPSPFWMIEDEHVFSDKFLIAARYANGDSWFQLVPKGGEDTQMGFDEGTRQYFDSHTRSRSDKIKREIKVESNYFVEDFLSGSHEWKFGFGRRYLEYTLLDRHAGDASRFFNYGVPERVEVYREGRTRTGFTKYSAYVNDVYTRGKLSLIFGLRYDWQKSVSLPAEIQASKVAPDLLPALTTEEIDPNLVWRSLSPRFAATYDLFGDGNTVLSLGLARFANKMENDLADHVSAVQEVYVTYYWNDLNGDRFATADELLGYPLEGIIDFTSGFDPLNPNDFTSSNTIDPSLEGPLTDEVTLRVEKALASDFTASAEFVYRRNHRFNWTPFIGVDRSNYIGPISGLLEYGGVTYPYRYWTLDQPKPAGTYLTNQPDYSESFRGLDLAVKKRLTGKWMMSASFTFQGHNRDYGEGGFHDPTNIEFLDGATLAAVRWMGKGSFLYRAPLGIDVSMFANVREGRIFNDTINVETPERAEVGLGARTSINIEEYGSQRYEVFSNFDIRLQKDLYFDRYGEASISVDFFNAFNFNTELARFETINSARFGQIKQILNPRVIRFGVRYRF